MTLNFTALPLSFHSMDLFSSLSLSHTEKKKKKASWDKEHQEAAQKHQSLNTGHLFWSIIKKLKVEIHDYLRLV